jgi:hypothetical protein
MRRFLQLAGLLIAVQALLWIIVGGLSIWFSPLLDPIFGVFVFAYFPTIKVVARAGSYVGGSNIIYPIFLGVPLGILIYGLVGAAAVCLIKRPK